MRFGKIKSAIMIRIQLIFSHNSQVNMGDVDSSYDIFYEVL